MSAFSRASMRSPKTRACVLLLSAALSLALLVVLPKALASVARSAPFTADSISIEATHGRTLVDDALRDAFLGHVDTSFKGGFRNSSIDSSGSNEVLHRRPDDRPPGEVEKHQSHKGALSDCDGELCAMRREGEAVPASLGAHHKQEEHALPALHVSSQEDAHLRGMAQEEGRSRRGRHQNDSGVPGESGVRIAQVYELEGRGSWQAAAQGDAEWWRARLGAMGAGAGLPGRRRRRERRQRQTQALLRRTGAHGGEETDGVGWLPVPGVPQVAGGRQADGQRREGTVDHGKEQEAAGAEQGKTDSDVDAASSGTPGPPASPSSSRGPVSPREWRRRQAEVVAAFQHAWRGYRAYAFGSDELLPLSRRGEDSLGGLGATAVDALDTAMLMMASHPTEMRAVVEEAGGWVQQHLASRLAHAGQVNLFETTIRVLGGLLAAHHLRAGTLLPPAEEGADGPATNASLALGALSSSAAAGRSVSQSRRSAAAAAAAAGAPVVDAGPEAAVYLRLAADLADRLLAAFTMSPSAVPLSDVVLRDRAAHRATTGGGESSTAECTTLQLEFWELSRLTGDQRYADAAMQVMRHVRDLPRPEGLVPIYIDPASGQFAGSEIRLGSRGDSFYEYLIKTWLQQRQVEPPAAVAFLRSMWDEAALHGVRQYLVAQSAGPSGGLTFVAERPAGIGGYLHPKMDHLVCFLPGSLALAATHGLPLSLALRSGLLSAADSEARRWQLQLAANLTQTCFEMYNVTATGLAPEIAYFEMDPLNAHGSGTVPSSPFARDINIHPMDRHNLLRPETVEALFYMFRVTGDDKYRHWGWQIFQAFLRHSRVASGGFTSLSDVTVVPPPPRDKQETFFLGETLKYLYLLFADERLLPLDQVVLNTEAHPLPIPTRRGRGGSGAEGRQGQ